jgi:hypothetical protein
MVMLAMQLANSLSTGSCRESVAVSDGEASLATHAGESLMLVHSLRPV